MALYVESVCNQHIFLKSNGREIQKFKIPWLFAKFSFSMTFPDLDYIFKIIYDFLWPWEPCWIVTEIDYFDIAVQLKETKI